MSFLANLLCLCSLVSQATSTDGTADRKSVLIYMRDQSIDEYGSERFLSFSHHLEVQLSAKVDVKVAKADVVGGWAVWPAFHALIEKYEFQYLLVCDTETRVHIDRLSDVLQCLNTDDVFVGYGLTDQHPTVIHHYGHKYGDLSYTDFRYPDFGAGLLLSYQLVTKLHEHFKSKSDFVIDPKHELALAAFKLSPSVLLQHEPTQFCLIDQTDDCVGRFIGSDLSLCRHRVSTDDIFFAVKTFAGFHKSRVVIAKRTWAKNARHIEFYSDVEDIYIPTVVLGVNNTERGHCEKTMRIIRRFVEQKNGQLWLAVVDDDTLLSVERLAQLLSCYNHKEEVVIGERYGYGFNTAGDGGYDYPTGGSGMFLSRPAAVTLAQHCQCPSPDSPDDMILGMCCRSHSIPIQHSSALHQARPIDYSRDYLERQAPISFHKHDNIDPYKVYVDYLSRISRPPSVTQKREHEEL